MEINLFPFLFQFSYDAFFIANELKKIVQRKGAKPVSRSLLK